jgi:hypothetical protein
MSLTIERQVEFTTAAHRRQRLRVAVPEPKPIPLGRVPRISKFMALAIRFESLLHNGTVKDYAELARLGHVTRARMTQIMNLRLLAADIQEDLLVLPRVTSGNSPIHMRLVLPITQVSDFAKQRRMWKTLKSKVQL